MLRFIYFIMCFYIFICIDLLNVLSNIVFIVIKNALIVLCSLKVKFFSLLRIEITMFRLYRVMKNISLV